MWQKPERQSLLPKEEKKRAAGIPSHNSILFSKVDVLSHQCPAVPIAAYS